MIDDSTPFPAAIAASESAAPDAGRVAMNRLLILGLLLRVGVLLLASPFNRDDHFRVIEFIAAKGSLPTSNVLEQSHHPPLYYLLMTPLYLVSPRGVTWPIHLASCVFSCANLLLIRRLMDHPLVRAISPRAAFRVIAFALVATHAQFIMFGSFISNDPLTQLIGTAQFAAVLAYLTRPDGRRMLVLALLVAIGLLTKGTFLLTGFALAVIVLRVEWSLKGARRALAITAAFCALWLVLGSYKYVENIVRVGRPFVYILDLKFETPYAKTIWRGPQTIYDLDVTKLIRHPVVRPAEPNSYPLTLYATFWYAHFGDSSFRGNVSGYESVGRITYAIAVVPTLLFILGVALATLMLARWLRGGGSTDATRTLLIASLALFLSNLAIIVAAGVRFDRWDSFQARLIFQSAMPMTFLFLAGIERVGTRRWRRATLLACCWATVACGVLYLLVEFALARRLLAVDESILFTS